MNAVFLVHTARAGSYAFTSAPTLVAAGASLRPHKLAEPPLLPQLDCSEVAAACRAEVAERLAAGCERREAKAHSDVRPAHLEALVRAGLLARQASDRFSFALPGAGPLIKSITSGRKACCMLCH